MYLPDTEETGLRLIDVSNKRWWIRKDETQWSVHRQGTVLSIYEQKPRQLHEKRWWSSSDRLYRCSMPHRCKRRERFPNANTIRRICALWTHVRIIWRPKSCSAREIIVRNAMVVCVHVGCCCFDEESKRKIWVTIWEISSCFGKALSKNWRRFSEDFNEQRHRLASHSAWTIDWSNEEETPEWNSSNKPTDHCDILTETRLVWFSSNVKIFQQIFDHRRVLIIGRVSRRDDGIVLFSSIRRKSMTYSKANKAHLPNRTAIKVAMHATRRPESLMNNFEPLFTSLWLLFQVEISSSIRVLPKRNDALTFFIQLVRFTSSRAERFAPRSISCMQRRRSTSYMIAFDVWDNDCMNLCNWWFVSRVQM